MTAHPDLDAIAHLDFQAPCQCPCHPNGCTNPATHAVQIHALHDCNREGLTPAGNRVELRCPACVRALQQEIALELALTNRWGVGQCDTCGAPLAALSDVLRAVKELS